MLPKGDVAVQIPSRFPIKSCASGSEIASSSLPRTPEPLVVFAGSNPESLRRQAHRLKNRMVYPLRHRFLPFLPYESVKLQSSRYLGITPQRQVFSSTLTTPPPVDLDDDSELAFLGTATLNETMTDNQANLRHQLLTSPLLTRSALEHYAADFPSRGLIGTSADDRVYVNTNAPRFVAFRCGPGKSHTVSCILESALIPDSRIGKLPEPLSALVFHFNERDAGRPSEAAFLSSPASHLKDISSLPQVTVLCSPTNIKRRQRAYASLVNFRVQPLYFSEMDLWADDILALMGCDNLEAFIRLGAPRLQSYFNAGGLVLVDLTDPFLDGFTAAVLFDIVLETFTQWKTASGKLVSASEAPYMYIQTFSNKRSLRSQYWTSRTSTSSTANQPADAVRQPHNPSPAPSGYSMIIATQEPTVIPPTILGLASTIICHRFSSPAWCTHLARHVSAGGESGGWVQQVMSLPTGHALVFSPTAVISAEILEGLLRPRLTLDGGASLLAVGRRLPAPTGSSSESASLSLSTPPTSDSSESYSPAEVETDPSGAAAVKTVAAGTLFAPPSAPEREVPAHLKTLVDLLLLCSTADTPTPALNLSAARAAIGWMGKDDPTYAGLSDRRRWARILNEAVECGSLNSST
ncbi:hypothetical protein B0H12DRAFT_1233206 [Mycena haematopus]|nr:hypothetical protein B0H12DRAFT_1233206 [Mycena haematopus]